MDVKTNVLFATAEEILISIMIGLINFCMMSFTFEVFASGFRIDFNDC